MTISFSEGEVNLNFEFVLRFHEKGPLNCLSINLQL